MSSATPGCVTAVDPLHDGELIYEVTLDIARRASKRFDVWLAGHMHEMLALPGFLAAQVLPPGQTLPAPEPGQVRRVVRYRLASYAALKHYLAEHSARMRADGLRHFGKQLQSSRRLLDTEGRELVSGDALPPATLRCLNCGAALNGEYCSVCGQPHHNVTAPLREVAGEFFGEHFGLDTKLIRSAVPLLFRPGFLSREYSAGRRVRYISPLRLYVFCSLLFFFVAWGTAPRQFFHFNAVPAVTAGSVSHPLSSSEQQEIRNMPWLTAQQKHAILAEATGTADASRAPAPRASTRTAADGNQNLEIFGRRIHMSKAEFQNRVETALEHDLPKLMFVFLPLVALLLEIFYLRTRRYYVEHLAFTLHNHAFVFVALLAMLLADLVARHAGWAAAPAHYFRVILGWYVVVYVFLAMLFYYRQSFMKTLGKYLLIGGIYWLCLFSVFMLGLVWVLRSAAA